MYPEPPSRETLQAALHAFIEIYARRHLDLYEERRCGLISQDEMSRASRRLTAIQAHIQAYWLNTPFVLPPEYQFDPEELTRVIQAEIDYCQILSVDKALVESLQVINVLIAPWAHDDDVDDDSWIEGEMPPVHWDG